MKLPPRYFGQSEVAPHGSDRERVRHRAQRGDAVAAVLVDEREIEVRVVASDQTHVRRFPRREADTSTSALAAVEVIRGYLVPVEQKPKDDQAPTEAAPIAPEASPARAGDARRSLSARLGGGFVSAGNFPTQAVVTLGGAKHFGRLGIEVAALATIPRDDGWCGGLDVALHYGPLGDTRPVSFAVAVGVMGFAVAYREDGKKYAADAAAIPHVGLGLRAPIGGPLSARVDGIVGVSLPSPAFKSKTGSDVRFGSSVQIVSAGLEMDW